MRFFKYKATNEKYDVHNFRMYIDETGEFSEAGTIIVEFCTPQGWGRLLYSSTDAFAADWEIVRESSEEK